MGNPREQGSITITRRQLLIGAGAAGTLGAIWLLGNRSTEAQSQRTESPKSNPTKELTPDDIARPFALAVLSGNVNEAIKYFAPDRQNEYKDREKLNFFSNNVLSLADCRGIGLKQESSFRRGDSNDTSTVTFSFNRSCQANVNGQPTTKNTLTVRLELVNGRFYPWFFF